MSEFIRQLDILSNHSFIWMIWVNKSLFLHGEKKTREALETELSDRDARIAILKAQIQENVDRLGELEKEKHAAARLQEAIDGKNKVINDLNNLLNGEKKTREVLETELLDRDSRIATLKTQIQQNVKRLAELEKDANSAASLQEDIKRKDKSFIDLSVH